MPGRYARNRKLSIDICIMVIISILLTVTGCASRTDVSEESAVSSEAQRQQDGSGHLRMTFLDTGKSDCIIMDLGDGVIMNDTADADDYENICSFLEGNGITAIDYMILSHFDKDHIGSAADLISTYEVGCVLMPDYEEDSVYYAALMDVLENSGTESMKLQEDYSFAIAGAEVYVSVPEQKEYEDDNNYSLITAVTYGENRFLLMGDAMKKRTGEFLKTEPGEEHYDLIKMPHHGDFHKKLDDLVECARPAWAVLTAGQGRRKLEAETLDLLDKYGCKVYDTVDGNVVVESDGENITVSQAAYNK